MLLIFETMIKAILTIISSISFLVFLSSCSSSTDRKEIIYVHDTVFVDTAPKISKTEPVAVSVPKYKIVRTATSYSDYDVVISPIDLNSVKYKADINLILDDIATKTQKSIFTAYIFDNRDAAELNYLDLAKGERLSKSQNEIVNRHLIDVFGKDIDGTVRNSYFIGIPADKRIQHAASEKAFDDAEFNLGYMPKIK